MPHGVHKKLKCKEFTSEGFVPQPHQRFVLNYLISSDVRGLILYHRLGSGKTCTSILISDEMLNRGRYEHVYVFSPGSLRQNFIDEYCHQCGEDADRIKDDFTFISYNANVGKYLPDSLDDSLIIIDEAHNLVNGIKNASKNARAIYQKIKDAQNVKILLLSATPVYNSPFEVSILVNLVKPRTFPSVITKDGVNRDAYDRLFDVQDDGSMVPKDKVGFLDMISGVISFMPGMSADMYPTVIHEPTVKTIMTGVQENEFIYKLGVEQQIKMPSMLMKRKDPAKYEFMERLYIMAKKNILSRRPSNFVYPEYADDINSMKDSVTPNGWVDHDAFDGRLLSTVFSPKFYALLENIRDNFRAKHMIFSFFKEKAGVNMVASLLEMCGVPTIKFTGDLDDKQKVKALSEFNAERNRYGDYYKAILVTDAGAEGITLMETQHVHILESDKRENKIQQVIGRAVRYKSHTEMPESERFVHVWRYWSTVREHNEPITVQNIDPVTEKKTQYSFNPGDVGIDEALYISGQRVMRSIDSNLVLLQEGSIENFDE